MYFIVLVLTSAAILVLLDSFSIQVLSRLLFVPSPFVAALAFQHSTLKVLIFESSYQRYAYGLMSILPRTNYEKGVNRRDQRW